MGGVEVMSELLQCYGEHKAVTQLGETWGKLGQRAVAKVQSGQLKDAGLQQKCRLGIGVGPEKMVQSSADSSKTCSDRRRSELDGSGRFASSAA